MILLTKTGKPAILRLKSLQWTVDVLEYHVRKEKIPKVLFNKYNHKQVKLALVDETNGKCAYCESKVTHVYPGDIEHIIPKSKFPDLAFDWENLTFSCSICNNLKSDYYDPTYPVVNPYFDIISRHITSSGSLIIHMPGSERGELTHVLLQLNRGDLIERREEALQVFRKYLDSYAKATVPILKDIYKKEILGMVDPSKEFSFVLKNALDYFVLKGLVFH
ncbi:hypothetical protein GCM10011495_32760 [Hymenobacter frigidus]|uniref:HNH nuclease domain-containing protein n=1 Tax=Hymenobacter frigidus TaxID=1524095 RepID=A0ABQ2AAZ3_9BACT|nr:HNH endonuclease [Hymenobacter frigidus]GGH89352.1 hypothetical protein GCM10011495_32760 [Hymenobacter frigidus]